MFKNVSIWRLRSDEPVTATRLDQALAGKPLIAPPGLTPASRGWLPPLGAESGLVHEFQHHVLIAMGLEERLLPAAVVKRELGLRAEAFEQERGFEPNRKVLRDLRQSIETELLPRAFIRRKVIRAWIDTQRELLIIDTPSSRSAEDLAALLRDHVPSLKIEKPDFEHSPTVVMTEWVSSGRAPGGLEAQDEIELVSSRDGAPTVRYLRHPLDGPDVKAHIRDGKSVKRLGLNWDGRVSFVLDFECALKKIRFHELSADDAAEDESGLEEFILMCGTLDPLLGLVHDALGGFSRVSSR